MKNKILRNKYLFIALAIIIIIILLLLVITNRKVYIPFEIKNIYITSTASGRYLDENNTENWKLSLFQNNDIYINVGLVDNMENIDKKDSIISKIYVENFNVTQEPKLGKISYYKLSDKEENLFEYTDNNLINDKYELKVVEKDAKIKNGEINQDGGQIALSIVNNDIIEYESKKETELTFDGTLLEKGKVNNQDIEFKVSMDLVIITKRNRKYKTNVVFDLPIGDIIINGFELKDNIDISQMKFELYKED